eukprot:COSAG05_NODE_1829_length_4002_cov_3.573917_2_plen_66_part_00
MRKRLNKILRTTMCVCVRETEKEREIKKINKKRRKNKKELGPMMHSLKMCLPTCASTADRGSSSR